MNERQSDRRLFAVKISNMAIKCLLQSLDILGFLRAVMQR